MWRTLQRAASTLVSMLAGGHAEADFSVLSWRAMYSRRRLPHEYPEGKAPFLTWHLHGAVRPTQFPPPGKLSSGQAFVWIDRYLDLTRTGPLYLKQPEIAKIVVNAIHNGVKLGHY